MLHARIEDILKILGDGASIDDAYTFASDLDRLEEVGTKLMPFVKRYFCRNENELTAAVIVALHQEGYLGEVIAQGKRLCRFDADYAAREKQARELVRLDPFIVASALEQEHPDKFRVVDLLDEQIQAEVESKKASGTHVPYDPNEPHPLASHPDPDIACWFRSEPVMPKKTVRSARQSLAARSGRSMRSIIADTTHMSAAEIDAIHA